VVRLDTMLYPGYSPNAGLLPVILHYGSDYKLPRDAEGGGPMVVFNKMLQKDLDIFKCGPNFFFFDAPRLTAAYLATCTQSQLLCVEHLQELNAALCQFYRENCAGPPNCQPQEFSAADFLVGREARCVDEHSACEGFAEKGECAANPSWMLNECARSCSACSALERELLRRLLGTRRLYGAGAAQAVGPVADAEQLTVFFRGAAIRRHFAAAIRRLVAQSESTPGVLVVSGARISVSVVGESDDDARPHSSSSMPVASGGGGGAEGGSGGGSGGGNVGDSGDSDGGGDFDGDDRGSDAGGVDREFVKLYGQVGTASFGVPLPCISLRAPLVEAADGCAPIVGVVGAVALVARGNCTFVDKALAMQARRCERRCEKVREGARRSKKVQGGARTCEELQGGARCEKVRGGARRCEKV